MKFDKFSPNLLSGIISILFGIFIYYKIPTEVEKPVLIFGQTSSKIDPQIVPTIIALMFLIFGLYTVFYEKDSKISNSWPKFTKKILINLSITILKVNTSKNNLVQSRNFKINYYNFFSNEKTVYIDCNRLMKRNFVDNCKRIFDRSDFAVLKHPIRKSFLDELID